MPEKTLPSQVRKILVATDRSESADRAVRWAAEMADRFQAQLILLQVVVPQPPEGEGDGRLTPGTHELAVTELEQYAAEVAGERGRARVVVDDDPARAIVKASDDAAVDVVVVGNVGMSGRKTFLLGNVPNRVSHNARCHVIIVNTARPGVAEGRKRSGIIPAMPGGTIAQVHKAALTDGDRVVIKVQRPTARTDILQDLGLLELFAEKTQERSAFRQVIDLPTIIEHLSASLRRELDFRQEAGNLQRMHEVLQPFSRLDVPRVYTDFSTDRLLVMEEIQGGPIRDAPQGESRTEAARQLLESYYQQILADGFFHADPHPGNMMWWNDRIYFLDLGMVGEIDPETRNLMLLLLMAFWRGDVNFLADVVLMLAGGGQRSDLDVSGFEAEVGGLLNRTRGLALREMQLGPILQEITEISIRHGVRLPASLALTGKALAQMQL